MDDQTNKTCDDCGHLKQNRDCREGPPQMFMLSGAPKGTIARPGQIPMTIILKYPTPPPGFPACGRHKVKVSLVKGGG